MFFNQFFDSFLGTIVGKFPDYSGNMRCLRVAPCSKPYASALPIRSGQRVCRIDSKSSHSSVEGKVLIKIFVNMEAHFLMEKTLDTF